MKPYRMVQLECCNRHGNKCIGVDSRCFPTHKITPQKPHEICLIKQKKRCSFFEKIILPLADKKNKNKDEYQKAKEIYINKFNIPNINNNYQSRKCPDCLGLLSKYQRFCDRCRKKRRRDSYKKRKKIIMDKKPQILR